MPPIKDLTGKEFGRLTVLYRADDHVSKTGRHDIVYHCKCSCGNECDVIRSALVNGHTTSCGCYRREISRKRMTKRDDISRKLRIIHVDMVDRCYNDGNKRYNRYGGRGIEVCEEWRGEDGRERFIEWARANGYEDGLTIDRINNDGNYGPDNCRWVTVKEQCNNRSTNTFLEVDGVKKTIAQWIDCLGIQSKRLYYYDEQKKVEYVRNKLRQKNMEL